MRYIIYFRDKSTMHVSQKTGEQVIQAKMSKASGVILNGACISTDFISLIKPIKKGWFSEEYVEQQQRLELKEPDALKFIAAPPSKQDA